MELWAAIRDQVGNHSTVTFNGESVLIKDLPAELYELLREEEQIEKALNVNQIPGRIVDYCAGLGPDFPFLGSSPAEMVSNLNFEVKQAASEKV